MLGKLIKHEWKGTYRVGCLMMLLMAGITFFGWLAFQSPMWKQATSDTYNYSFTTGVELLDILSIFTLVLYFVMLIVVLVGIVVYLAVHFYKTVYTDEGYLTHTLPVTKHQLLFSKILVGGLWVMSIYVMVYLSLFALGVSLVRMILPDGYTFARFWGEFGDLMTELRMDLEGQFGLNFVIYRVFILLSLLIGPFLAMATVYGAISLGQLFTRHRVLMAIVSYIGIAVLNGFLGSVVQSVIGTDDVIRTSTDIGSYIDVNMITSFGLNLIIAVALYMASWLVMTKKLNME